MKGDVLRIERVGAQVVYKVNGVTAYVSTVPSTGQLMADVTIMTGLGYTSGTRLSFGGNSKTVTRTFNYDHAGRLLKTWHQVDDGDTVLLAHNEYNELGQLVTKKLHSENPVSAPDNQRTYKQHEDFRYNIRGWLTRINNSDLSPEGGSNVPRDLFGMNLIYNETVPGLANTPAFNGNISAMKWSTNQGLGVNIPSLGISEVRERAYAFGYDPMNRLLSASQRTKNSNNEWNTVGDFNEDSLSYDLNGNILMLHRNGENASPMDRLGYTYIGNQLQEVHDGPEKSKGFVDGNATATDYTYDANGNMTVDRNKFITSITYNHLNLPATVTKKTGDYIKYTYDATGRKLSQSVYNATHVMQKKTDYAGEFIYEKTRSDEIQSFVLLHASDFTAGTDGWTAGDGCTVERHQDNIGGRNDALKITTVTAANNRHYFQNHSIVAEPNELYVIRVDFYIPAANTTWDGFAVTNSGGEQVLVDARNMPRGVWTSYATEPVRYTAGNRFYIIGTHGASIFSGSTGEAGYMMNFRIEKANFLQEELLFINHEEGRVVMTDAQPEYQYHLRDHLGNVRMTFTSKHEEESAIATVEPANVETENLKFRYYDEAVVVHSRVFDHTNNDPNPATDPEGYSMRLTGGIHHQYGLAKSLSVMPGDTVKMSVFAKYVKPTSQGTWPVDIAGLMNDLANPSSGLVVDGKLAGSIGGGVFPFLGLMQRTQDSDTVPKAYLNYIVFDQRDTLVDFGYIRVNQDAYETGANGDHQHLFHDLVIRQPGYVYIYLSNENETPVDVFFDDFSLEHVKSPVVQADDYYPFGLTFNSYSRENTTPNFYQYNGKEKQDELDLGWLDYGARMFDPVTARWMAVDPAAELMKQYSPYVYSFDNPVRFIDKDGMIPEQVTTDPPDLKAITSGAQVDMTGAPGGSKVNAAGHPRNGPWFWKQMLKEHPEMFSADNAAEISRGRAPRIDDKWIDFNPSHAAYKGDKLIHHHVDQGHMATGIPEQVHKKHFSDLHANTGGRKGGGGALSKLGMFAGLLGLAYDIFSDDPHALGMQFSAGNKLNTVYYDMGTDQYFEVTERGTEKDENGNKREYSIYNTYESYQYNEDTKRNEGVNKTGTYKAIRVKSLDEAYQYLYQQG